jgi:hypothetical protein
MPEPRPRTAEQAHDPPWMALEQFSRKPEGDKTPSKPMPCDHLIAEISEPGDRAALSQNPGIRLVTAANPPFP